MERLKRNLIRLIPGSLLPILNEYSAFIVSRWFLIVSDLSQRRLAWGADPLGGAAAAGTSTGFAVRIPLRDVELGGQAAHDDTPTGPNWAMAFGRLPDLANEYPGDEHPRRTFANALGKAGKRERQFPSFPLPFGGFARSVGPRSGLAVAHSRISSYGDDPITFEGLLNSGKILDQIGKVKEADGAFEQLTTLFPEREQAWTEAVERLDRQGLYFKALTLLSRAIDGVGQSRPRENRLRFLKDVTSGSPYHIARRETSLRRRRSIAVLSGLLDELVRACTDAPPAITPVAKSIVMINSQLGPGGAERQLMNTVVALQNARGSDNRWPLFDCIKVVAQSCRSRRHDGFYRPFLQCLGTPVIEYEDLPLFGGDFTSSAVYPVLHTLRFLPLSIVGGILRLTDALRQWRPETVLIWQEDVGLEAGLAALIARVPRIIVTLRSVPSIDRPELFRPENLVILRALSAARNVTLACNSRFAAARYAEWLAIEPEKIAVIANGTARLPIIKDQSCEVPYREFDRRTEGSQLTVGVVMRMDDNKRPMLWIEIARNVLKKLPSSRFILVGDGPLRRRAMQWTRRLGLADRFLFTGVSPNVGFWLSKMDVFLLVSRHEGLPNVLIEAQLAGIAVVTAAGGGASEALIPGKSGIVIDPDSTAEQIATEIVAFSSSPQRLRLMGEAGIKWVTEAFSTAKMLRETLALLVDDEQTAPDLVS